MSCILYPFASYAALGASKAFALALQTAAIDRTPRQFAADLFQLNCRAYQDRYPGTEESEIEAARNSERVDFDFAGESMAALKTTLRRVRYQCSDADDYETNDTAQQLERLVDLFENELAPAVAEAEKMQADLEEIERQMLLEKSRRERDAKYQHLTRATDKGPRGYALGAKNLRAELKAAFPGIKFSVTSKSYSGGCSIDVTWMDGPTQKAVEAFSSKYQQGNFDGMTDSYDNHKNDVFTPVFGGAKYVFEHREYSREFLEAVAAKVAPEYGQPVPPVVLGYGGAWIDRTDLKPRNDWDCSSTIDREIMRKAAATDARPKPRLRYNWQTATAQPVA